jgi:hypothetical protein
MQHGCLQLHPHGTVLRTARRRGCWFASPAVRPLGLVTAKGSAQQEVLQPFIWSVLHPLQLANMLPLVLTWRFPHAALQLLQSEQQQTAEAPKGDPRDRFTGYEPFDSEGNPWWEPPERDLFEGGAWEVGLPQLADC